MDTDAAVDGLVKIVPLLVEQQSDQLRISHLESQIRGYPDKGRRSPTQIERRNQDKAEVEGLQNTMGDRQRKIKKLLEEFTNTHISP